MGPALGQHGVNIMEFCKAYNAQTQDKVGTVVPVEITIFEDRSFTFVLKTPPAAVLIRQAAGVAKGSARPNKEKVGKITQGATAADRRRSSCPDLNANDVEAAMKTLAGTARSMGVTVVE